VKVAPNATFQGRSGTVRVTSGSDEIAIVSVRQAGRCQPESVTIAMPTEARACEGLSLSVTSTSGRSPDVAVAGPGRIANQRLVFDGSGTVTVIGRLTESGGFCASRAEHSIAVSRCDQSIDFDLPPVTEPADLPLPLVSTATSGLPVDLTVIDGPGRIEGGRLDFDAAGATTLRASQGGDARFAPAPTIDRTTVLEALPQEIVIELPANVIFANQTIPLSASTLGEAPLSFESSGPAEIVPEGLRLTGPGLVRVTATAAATSTHAPATAETLLRVFSVAEAEALKRQGFVMNAIARGDLRAGTLARIVAAYWSAAPNTPLSAEIMADAWDSSAPPETTRFGAGEADLMGWMFATMQEHLIETGDTDLAAAVTAAAADYDARYDATFTERLDAYTRLGLRIGWRLESYTRSLSFVDVGIGDDWISESFGAFYDVARETPELAAAIDAGDYDMLFEVGVPTDPTMEDVVGGMQAVFNFEEAPQIVALLEQIYATVPCDLPGTTSILDRRRSSGGVVAAGLTNDPDLNALLDRLQEELIRVVAGAVDKIKEGAEDQGLSDADAAKKRKEAFEAAEKTINGLDAVWDGAIRGLGTFVGLDADTQKLLNFFGKLHFSVAKTYVNALKLIDSIKTNGLAAAKSIALSGDLVKSIATIADLLSAKPSTDQQILKGLETISQQITDLRGLVDLRFDRVDAKLNLALLTLNDALLGLADIDAALGDVAATLASVRVDIAAFELNVHRQFGEVQRDAFEEQIGNAIDRRQNRLPLEEFRAAENQFFVHATANARGLALLPESLCPDIGPCGAGELSGPSVRYHYLRTLNEVPTRIELEEGEEPLPPLGPQGALVNPVEWVRAAGAYLTLVEQQGQHIDQIEADRVIALHGAGHQTVQALRRMTIRPGPEGNLAPRVYDGLLDEVEAAAENVRSDLARIHDDARIRPAMHLITARTPWPNDLAEISALNHYRTTVEGQAAESPRAWAQEVWAPYMTAPDLPTAETNHLRRLAIAGFLQASPSGQFFGSDRTFVEARVASSPAPLTDVADGVCPDQRNAVSVGVQWCLAALQNAVAGFNFRSNEFFCPEAEMNVRKLFASQGNDAFRVDVGRTCIGKETPRVNYLEEVGPALNSHFDMMAEQYTAKVLRQIVEQSAEGSVTDLRAGIDRLDQARATLLVYIAAAMPASLLSNEALMRLAGGALLSDARDTRSALVRIYSEADRTDRPPYEELAVSEDVATLRAALHGLIVEIEAGGISEPELLFDETLRDLEVLEAAL